MNQSMIVLIGLCLIIATANANYYINPNGVSGGGQPFRRRYNQYEPSSNNYGRNSRQGIQNNYDRQRRQDEYNEAVGPVHTFVKTDEHAHFKWGVRHHIG